MRTINNEMIVEGLRELSNKDLQKKLWLSNGSADVSSFVEVVEHLFTDSGLSDALNEEDTGLPREIEKDIKELAKSLDSIDGNRQPIEIIEDTKMSDIRRRVARLLEKLNAYGW